MAEKPFDAFADLPALLAQGVQFAVEARVLFL